MDGTGLATVMEDRRAWSQNAAQLGRTSLLGVTFIFVLLGMAAAGREVAAGTLALTMLAALTFHVAVYAANDIVDLPIDRTVPRRAASPLVQGAVTTQQVGVVVVASVIAALALSLAVSVAACGAMAVSLALLLVYDVWGKRCRFPPLTDLAQGGGWAALVWFGSACAGHPNRTTVWLGLYVVVAILLVNGVHGAVRDLANDGRHGARTTARWLGASVDDYGAVHIPARLWVYGIVLHVADVAVLVGALVTSDEGHPIELAVVLVGGIACLGALCVGLARAGEPNASLRAGFLYIIVMLVLPATLVVDHLRGTLLAATVVLFVVPWVLSGYVRSSLLAGARRERNSVAT